MENNNSTPLIEAPKPYLPISANPDQPVAVHKDYQVNTDLFATKKRRPHLGDKDFHNLPSWIEYVELVTKRTQGYDLDFTLTTNEAEIRCEFLNPNAAKCDALPFGSATLNISTSPGWKILQRIQHRKYMSYDEVMELVHNLEYEQCIDSKDGNPTVEDFESIKTEQTQTTAESFNEFTGTKKAKVDAPQKIIWKTEFFSQRFATADDLKDETIKIDPVRGSISLRWKYRNRESKENLCAQILTPNWGLITRLKTEDLRNLIAKRLDKTIYQ